MISYIKIKKRIVVGATPGVKFLARIFREKAVDLKTIADRISATSTMSKGDIIGVLQQLEIVLAWYIVEGIPIKLGILGSFETGIQATACNTIEEVTEETIKRKYIIFKPSIELKKMLNDAKVNYLDLDIAGLQIPTTTKAEANAIKAEAKANKATKSTKPNDNTI